MQEARRDSCEGFQDRARDAYRQTEVATRYSNSIATSRRFCEGEDSRNLDRQYGGKVVSKLKGSRPVLKSDGSFCSVTLSEYSSITHERIQRPSLSLLSSVPIGFETAAPPRRDERLPNPECEKKPSRNFKIWNRPLPTPMNFGIFSSSRGGNPQQSETNLNQKTPETLLLPGPSLSTPKFNELAVRGKSPVEGAAGSCSSSARSEEDGDPGDLLRRTTKPTAANVRRPEGYAPLPLGCAESTAPRSWNGYALRHRSPGA